MSRKDDRIPARIAKSDRALLVLFLVAVCALANLDAVVDSLLHPEIAYFDPEHLVVGGLTGLVSAALFGVLLSYVRHLRSALDTIRTLEGFLPICAACKKIRNADEEPGKPAVWQPIESYVSERTEARFSHGICPDCRARLYPAELMTE